MYALRRTVTAFRHAVELLVGAALVLFCAVIAVLATTRLVLAGHWLAALIPAAVVGGLAFSIWLVFDRSGRARGWLALQDAIDTPGAEGAEDSEPPSWE